MHSLVTAGKDKEMTKEPVKKTTEEKSVDEEVIKDTRKATSEMTASEASADEEYSKETDEKEAKKVDVSKEDGKSSSRIDRRKFKYSLKEFMKMSRKEQKKLLQRYLCDIKSDDFDKDKMFQISRTTLARKCCWENGFVITSVEIGNKTTGLVVDLLDEEDLYRYKRTYVNALAGCETGDNAESSENKSDEGEVTIKISHGTRKEKQEKKVTWSKETAEILDELLDGLPNAERSKVFDEMIRKYAEGLLKLKKEGKFHVEYLPMEGKRLF